jgi:hypothetical protein
MYAFDVTHFSFILVTALLLSLLKDDDDDDDDDARKEKQQQRCCCAVTVNDDAIFVGRSVVNERARVPRANNNNGFVWWFSSFEVKSESNK